MAIEKAVFADTKREAIARANWIALQHGYTGTLTVEQKPYATGGYYWLCKWS